MRLTATLAAVLLFGAAGTARADADSLVDHLGPREIGTGEAARAGAIGAMAARLNPSGLPLNTELVFDGLYGYRASDSASLMALAACDSTNAAPGCFYYTYVGSDAMEEGHLRAHTGGFTLARPVHPRLIIGSGVKYYDVEVAGMDAGHGVNWDLGATVRATETLNLGVVGYNLWGDRASQFPRAMAVGIMMRPIPALTAAFDAVWTLDSDASTKTGRYGGGLEYFASGKQGQMGYPIRAGVVHDVGLDGTYLTGGLGFATLKLGVDVGARKEIAGGDDFAITASLRVYGPRRAM